MSDDATDDTTRDMSEVSRWLTYSELAKARGISRPSAIRLAIRHHWRRQKANSGREVRVLVPAEALTSVATNDTSEVKTVDGSGDIARLTAAFDAALAALRTAHAGEVAALQARIDTLQAALDAAKEAEAAWNVQTLWGRLRAAWRGARPRPPGGP